MLRTDGNMKNAKRAKKSTHLKVDENSNEWTRTSDNNNHEMKQEKKSESFDAPSDDSSDEELKPTYLRGED